MLNRVTGYDPSVILGHLQSNGRVFLLNPYGVVFGAGARVDVGGLVASHAVDRPTATSSPAATAYVGRPAGAGAARRACATTARSRAGRHRRAGRPDRRQHRHDRRHGGRVGLAAANAVLVDVEGDGLIFFQASATRRSNRLDQLGRIQADGGSVELRAAARAAFADTVLNMTGIVQARSIGQQRRPDRASTAAAPASRRLRAARRFAAAAPASAAARHRARARRSCSTRRRASTRPATPAAASIRVGGGFHGTDAGVRNAEQTIVAPGAQLRADAIDARRRRPGRGLVRRGDAVPRQHQRQGGAQGGNGGSAEVSGKAHLDYDGPSTPRRRRARSAACCSTRPTSPSLSRRRRRASFRRPGRPTRRSATRRR